MSGGFFRGTSADQDTRFSNKQAKLLKSQKFAPELDHLVNMTKVNMEVIKPWITRRVTEFLGFEDEVLINFIHGLLDAKEVNGKEVQIQITGFMEKNTGKFMKELWTLLLSAQKNTSGVPQQFLDAKEEEIRKKKVENDKITSEIQRQKDKEDRENMQERLKKLDSGFDAKNADTASDPTLKLSDSGNYIQYEKETDKRNGVRARSRSPHSPAVSTSPHRHSPSRSLSKSFSNSRSYSSGRHRSRSISRSPEARGHSFSSKRICRSPRRRSISPPRRFSPVRSPLRRGLSYSRRRSRSRSNYRSPSPMQCRRQSPFHRSSPSFRRHRTSSLIRRRGSPSPVHHRRSPSPARRRRSPSPWRRRAPVMWHRSPSPVRRPPIHVRRRSRSPLQSPSPKLRRDGSRTQHRTSLSPLWRRSPVYGNKRVPRPSPRRSPSPDEWSSQSPIRQVSPSPVRRNSPRHQRTPVQSSRGRVRMQERLPPEARQPSSPLHSVQRDKNWNSSHYKSQDSISMPEKSPSQSVSPQARKRTDSEDRSPHESPRKHRGEKLTNERSLSPYERPGTQNPSQYSIETSEGAEETYYSRENRDPKSKSSRKKSKYSSPLRKRNDSPAKFCHEEEFSPERAAGHLASEYHGYDDKIDRSKNSREIKSYKSSGKGDETSAQLKSPVNKESSSYKKVHESNALDIKKSDDKDHSHSNHNKDGNWHHKSIATQSSVGIVDRVNQSASNDSSSEESGKHRREGKDRKKHRRSHRKFKSSDEDYSHDSELEDRKEAKRRKKEERKSRKEEKRRRREERRGKKEERHAEKMKMKSKTDDYISDDKEAERIDSHRSDSEDALSEQKKLEIELRNKALDSLKAKRGMNH